MPIPVNNACMVGKDGLEPPTLHLDSERSTTHSAVRNFPTGNRPVYWRFRVASLSLQHNASWGSTGIICVRLSYFPEKVCRDPFDIVVGITVSAQQILLRDD